jgi:hypothetical protein
MERERVMPGKLADEGEWTRVEVRPPIKYKRGEYPMYTMTAPDGRALFVMSEDTIYLYVRQTVTGTDEFTLVHEHHFSESMHIANLVEETGRLRRQVRYLELSIQGEVGHLDEAEYAEFMALADEFMSAETEAALWMAQHEQ